ncbi:immunity 49 family protein [Streptomyces sp. NPDC053048]|uniref:immunity 49 family protein n=1 Tax=Streptomyces sp. NPDC053048 TaxID=3365694 RepID=UPI0037D49B02
MAVTVPRHKFPADDAAQRAERLDASVMRKVEALEGSPRGFNMAFHSSLLAANTHLAVNADASLLPTWEAVTAAMQIGSALFASATTTEETVECRIAHKVRTIPATGTTYSTDAGNWVTAFFLAVICRERDRVTELAKVPVSLLRDSGAEYDEYIYPWVETLQTWRLGGDIGEKLVAAMDGTDPDVLQVTDRETMLRIIYPPINLFYRYIAGDQEAFNAELAKAVQWHKDYWTSDDERASESTGQVAWELLAITCLAYDAGFPIEVESDYLPKHLIERSWLGEFDT